jgi:hypothetical protein
MIIGFHFARAAAYELPKALGAADEMSPDPGSAPSRFASTATQKAQDQLP